VRSPNSARVPHPMRAAIADLPAVHRGPRVFDERSALYAVGTLLTFIVPLPLYWLFAPARDFTEAGLYIAIAEAIVVLLVAVHAAKDNFELGAFCIGLIAKLGACGIYLKLLYTVYLENDAFGYFNHGLAFSSGGTAQFVYPFVSTNAINNLATLLVLVTPSITFTFVTFALVGYFGQMLLYRAFCVALPQGNRRLAALMCFLFPSLVYWTSPLGKDALVLFGLGWATYGAAKLFSGRVSVVPLVGGLLIIQLVRPHIAALFGGSLALSYLLLWRSRNVTAIVVKFVAVPLLVASVLWLTSVTQTTFRLNSIEGATTRAEKIRGFTGAQGGSDFGYYDSLGFRVLTAPFLLFRPFPWEVGNFLSGIASAEGLFTLMMLWTRRRAAFQFIRFWPNYPFIAFIMTYSLLTIASLSTVINNMGTLARQRVMVFPLFVVLACVGFEQARTTSTRRTRIGNR
jgi:hypothetical protein